MVEWLEIERVDDNLSVKIDKKKFNKVVPKGFTYSVSQDGSGDYDGITEEAINKAISELPSPPEAETVVLDDLPLHRKVWFEKKEKEEK